MTLIVQNANSGLFGCRLAFQRLLLVELGNRKCLPPYCFVQVTIYSGNLRDLLSVDDRPGSIL